jgi:hypothetical protein
MLWLHQALIATNTQKLTALLLQYLLILCWSYQLGALITVHGKQLQANQIGCILSSTTPKT